MNIIMPVLCISGALCVLALLPMLFTGNDNLLLPFLFVFCLINVAVIATSVAMILGG